jgi:glycosyltransferase involved in cell wall biosynthesis
VRDGVNGVLRPDTATLAAAVDAWYGGSPEARNALAAQCRAFARPHTWSACADATFALYRRLAAR